jgi:hypothetical protein
MLAATCGTVLALLLTAAWSHLARGARGGDPVASALTPSGASD